MSLSRREELPAVARQKVYFRGAPVARQTGVAEVGEHPPKLQVAKLAGGGVPVHPRCPRELEQVDELTFLTTENRKRNAGRFMRSGSVGLRLDNSQ